MNAVPASLITKAASTQTYYTIRFLADRDRVDDAYRAYGYFRWVDDTLDAASASDSDRRLFLERQQFLLESCYRGEPPRVANPQEQMLIELVRQEREKNSGLRIYLRNMMRVMDFDVRRRGRLISQVELTDYTRWLASAVTECIHYFVGHDAFSPHDATRYLAVSAAHVVHMLRDTFDDAQLGYYNIPREVLEAHHIGPEDVQSDAQAGIMTIFSQTAGRWPLDTITNRALLFSLGMVMAMEKFATPGLEPLREMLQISLYPLFIDPVGSSRQFYSRSYLREMEMHFPFRFDYLHQQRKKLSQHRTLLNRLVETVMNEQLVSSDNI